MYERYDYPPGHPKHAGSGGPGTVSWAQILECWAELVFDFQHLLHTNLIRAWRTESWSWFDACVDGLLASADSQLRAQLSKAG